MSCAWCTLWEEAHQTKVPKTGTHQQGALFLTPPVPTFVVDIELIGVRGIFSGVGVPSAPDLQPKLQGIYLRAFFISYTKGGGGGC